MGTNCAPLLAQLLLHDYESSAVIRFSRTNGYPQAKTFEFTRGYIDDLISVNNPRFDKAIKKIYRSELTLCEATARSTKLRKMQFFKSVFYQKNEALLFITTLPCLKVFASLITKNKSKSSWHTEKFAKSRLKEKSSGRMRTKRQNRKVCSCSLRSISSSPGH